MLPFETETEAQAILLYPFTVFSSCKRKLSVCKRTKRIKRIYPSMAVTYLILSLLLMFFFFFPKRTLLFRGGLSKAWPKPRNSEDLWF